MRRTVLRAYRVVGLAAAWVLALTLAAAARPARAGVDAWTSLGPDGGPAAALAASAAQPGLLYAGSTGSGVYRSEDGGATWVGGSGGFGSVKALVADPRTAATVYAIDYGGQIWMSVDAGATWGHASPVSFGTLSLAIDPRSPATMYAGTMDGVWKSVDGGGLWTRLAAGDGHFDAIAVDPSQPGTVYAMDDLGPRLLRSTDAGETWVEAPGLDLSEVHVFPGPPQIAFDPATVPSVVYVGFQVFGWAFAYRSADAGDTWRQPAPGDYSFPLAVGQGIVYAGDVKSTDGGVTWTPAAPAPGTPLALVAAPGSASTVYAATLDRGVWKSGDAAASWQAASRGIASTRTYAMAIDPRHPRILYAVVTGAVQGPGLLKSGSGGQQWRLVGPPWLADYLPGYLGALAIDPVRPTILYAGSPRGLAKSTDGGATWNVLVGKGLRACFGVSQLAVDPVHPETLYAAAAPASFSACASRCPALESIDGGNSWSCLGLAVDQVSGLFLAPGAPSILYAIGQFKTRDGKLHGGLWKTTDAGLTWRRVDAGLHLPSSDSSDFFVTLAIDPTDANRVFLSAVSGIFRTTNGGRTWYEYSHNLPLLPPYPFFAAAALAIDPHAPATVYAAGDWGVYRSTNGGQSWYSISEGLPDFAFLPGVINSGNPLVVDPRQPGKLYAATVFNGLYTYTVQ